MPSLHQEIHLEAEICSHLATHGWPHDEGAAGAFDTASGLYPPDLWARLQASQPDSWQRLHKTHGAQLPQVLADRVRKSLNERGTLEVLRRGVEMLGLKEPLQLAQFEPALGLNPAIQARYEANRLRVLRQVHHSPNAPKDALELVLCLNGVPVATAELKSNFTQSVHDAVDQYRRDRHHHPKFAKGGVTEPVLGFSGGALVHFAVSQSEVMMATRLAGPATSFLPFNRGNQGGAGNAPNPQGFATAYLWEEVWARESWLDILHRDLVGKRDEKKQAYLNEIIEKVNDLFEGELTDDDQLVYVNGVLKGKLLENETLVQQAASNSKEQLANSPDLNKALVDAIIDAFEAHQAMS